MLEQLRSVVSNDEQPAMNEAKEIAFNENTKLGDLLSKEAATAVPEKYLPGISTNSMISMGGRSSRNQRVDAQDDCGKTCTVIVPGFSFLYKLSRKS